MHRVDDAVLCLGDINGHFGRHIDGFNVVSGGCGVGQKNALKCFLNFVPKKNYMCQINDIREEGYIQTGRK